VSLETEILNLLASDATVFGITGDNLRHEWVEKGVQLPALTITRISTLPEYDLMLASLHRVRIQIDCFADGFEEVRTMADAVTAVLHAYSGAAGTFQIDSIVLDNETSLGEKDGDKETRRISLDFFVTHI
jgi:hypothetical protein